MKHLSNMRRLTEDEVRRYRAVVVPDTVETRKTQLIAALKRALWAVEGDCPIEVDKHLGECQGALQRWVASRAGFDKAMGSEE